MRLAVIVALLSFLVPARAADPQLELRPGDRIAIVGNALAERMQHDGQFEVALHRAFPEHRLSLRNLGFSGDGVRGGQRTAGFGSQEEWLARVEADVVIAFVGFGESFEGPDGVRAFGDDLGAWLAQLQGDGRRVMLVGPTPGEDTANERLPSARSHRERLAPYANAMADMAARHGVPFVDPLTTLRDAFAAPGDVTINGVHLNEAGHRLLTEALFAGIAGAGEPAPLEEGFDDLRMSVLLKNAYWHNRYRATDGYNVYGGRSSLTYDGVTNFEVLQRELEILDALCDRTDAFSWLVAQGLQDDQFALALEVGRVKVPDPIPVETNKPGDGPDGAHVYRDGTMALDSMTVASGLEAQLFVDESMFPEFVNPVQMAFDTAGRLWVAVWPTYPHGLPDDVGGASIGQGLDALLVLEDFDGDGRADSCRTFAEGLHNPTGFEFWNGGVLVATAPDLLFLKDEDGDGRASSEERTRLLHGLSSADTHHSANSFVIGPDGALYFQEGIFHQSQVESIRGVVRNHDACVWRYDPRTHDVERYIPFRFLNPHGHVFDRWGQNFVTDGTGNVNYVAGPMSGHAEFPAKRQRGRRFFPQRSRPAAATEILSSRHMPRAFRDSYLIANVIGFRGIFQYDLLDDGAGFAAEELEPILFSDDLNFRPVDMEVGPDGALYVADWHNAIIGHMQHHLRDPSRDQLHGRVYRIVAKGEPLLDPVPLAGQPVAALLDALKTPEDRVRYRARIELSGRDTNEVVASARRWVNALDPADPEFEHHLLEALWVQQGHTVVDRPLLERLLGANDFRARAAAVRVVRHMRREITDAQALLAQAVGDEHPRVRCEAVVGLSFFPNAAAAEAALGALSQPMDPFLDDALHETLVTLDPHWRGALARGEAFASGDATGLAHVLAKLSTDELVAAAPSAERDAELLTRHGLDVPRYRGAAERLADARGTSTVDVLLDAIAEADGGHDHGHVDHRLMGLFATLRDVDVTAAADALARLSREGKRPSTRRLATAARLDARGDLDAAWREASGDMSALVELIEALPSVRDGAMKAAAVDRLIAQLDAPTDDAAPLAGRYVRVSLAGEKRTLTLAEVEVFAGGVNVAPRGSATQSSTNWGGTADKALDGNTSGAWGGGAQTHTMEDQPNPWWELDLGGDQRVDRVALWNRTDGSLGRRLDDVRVELLDAQRRVVSSYQHAGDVGRSTTWTLESGEQRARRAAVRALGSLGVRGDDVVPVLTGLVGDDVLGADAVAALRAVPANTWPEPSVGALATSLADLFARAPAERWMTPSGRETLALTDDLLPRLPDAVGAELRRTRRALGPQVLVVRPVHDAIQFDRAELTVIAGLPVELLFDNTDIMPHNLVVTAPGALATVGRAAEAMAADPTAQERAFVPDLPEVLHATGLLSPGDAETLRFDAPTEPGRYPFVCTFPGHWTRMNGVLHVVASVDELDPIAPIDDTPAAVAAARPFVAEWTVSELRPILDRVPDASPTAGREIFEAASCVLCHAVGGQGGITGPAIETVADRWPEPELVLAQIVDPSAHIAEGYASEILVLDDGDVVSGRIVAEDVGTLTIQTNPYDTSVRTVDLARVTDRWTSQVSAMPEGLLSTFTQDEITALMAYVLSVGD